jgi:hypothetical protein
VKLDPGSSWNAAPLIQSCAVEFGDRGPVSGDVQFGGCVGRQRTGRQKVKTQGDKGTVTRGEPMPPLAPAGGCAGQH